MKTELALPDQPDDEMVVTALQGAIESEVDPVYSESLKRFVPGEQPSYGVRVPDLRQLARQVRSTYGKEPAVILPIALKAWGTGWREQQLVALFLMADLRLSPEERWNYSLRFLPEVSNWELCDQLCSALLGQALVEDPIYMHQLETWVNDPNLWVRRAAVVSPVMLRRARFNQGLANELDERTLALCKCLLDDAEHYIRKAVDWSIRESIKRNYDLGAGWMFAQTKEPLSRTARSTLRQAAQKLSPEDKAKFLAELDAGKAS